MLIIWLHCVVVFVPCLRCRVPTLICLAHTIQDTVRPAASICCWEWILASFHYFPFFLAFILLLFVTLNAEAACCSFDKHRIWIYTKIWSTYNVEAERKHKLSICVRPWAAPTLNAQNAHKFSLYIFFLFFIHLTQRESNERHCDTATYWNVNMPSNFTTFHYI